MTSKVERHAAQLSALGHPVRLQILRFVVQAGGDGAPAGDILSHVDLPASTLSHHLKRLVDLTDQKPQKLTDELAQGAELLITMGCGEQCPAVPGLRREDWPLDDPKGKSIEHVRAIRDDVRQRVLGLLRREGWENQ